MQLKLLLALILLIVLAEAPLGAATPVPVPTGEVELRDALRALVAQIQDLDQQIRSTEEAIRTTPSEDLRSLRVVELRDLQTKRSEARLDLLGIISDADLSGLQSVEDKPFTLQGSIEDLLRPLVEELRRATADTREHQALADRYADAERQSEVLKNALASLDRVLPTIQDSQVRAMLTSVRSEFSGQAARSNHQLTVLDYRLRESENEHRSFVTETSGFLAEFFRKRGRNLLLAILAAVVIAAGFRWFHLYLHNHTPVFRRGRTQAARLLDVVLYTLTFLSAVVAFIVVFLIAGDWVMLGLVALLLLGLVFTAKDALPGYMDEIRLMLNLGAVRENERLIFNGLPWMVENLTFFTILRNPALRGGVIRMPIAQLHGMLSRPSTENEPYFPSEEDDWVLLDDSTYGRIVFQSAEMVRIQLLGGALKMYSTTAYLDQNPQNHSHGFRIRTTLGIDYNHQTKVTGEILEKLNLFFREKIEKEIDPHGIRSLKIEFAMANASSLDYDILLDLDGSLAAKYYPLTRALQRIGVDACTEFGLIIPFQQITLHRANEPAPSKGS